MKKIVIVVAIAVIVIVGGVVALNSGNDKKSSNTTTQPSSSSSKTTPKSTDQSTAQTVTPVSKDGTETVTINANDTSATPNMLNVTKGDKVVITFNVLSQGTYHGGLTFKSADPVVESDPIQAGSSGDVTFTATKSFQFTPYWYQSGVKKDYVVSVNVL